MGYSMKQGESMKINSGFKICEGSKYVDGEFMRIGHGFHIKFENSVVVSVQFGYVHYRTGCDLEFEGKNGFSPLEGVPDAEVAIFIDDNRVSGEQGVFITRLCLECRNALVDDAVAGWVKPDRIPEILKWARDHSGTLTPEEKKAIHDEKDALSF